MNYKYRYLYEIHILNELSSFHDTYYFGQHSTNNLNDNYYGSGTLLHKYIKKYGKIGLNKTILGFYDTQEALNAAETTLICEQQKLLGIRCLNIAEGGAMQNWTLHADIESIERWRKNQSDAKKLYWSTLPEEVYLQRVAKLKQQSLDIVKNSSEAQLQYRAMQGGLGNKRRLENPEAYSNWVKTCKTVHANESAEDKAKRYTKVSNALKDFYSNPANADILQQRNLKNIETNKKVSKIWRAEFYTIFQATPESFRCKGLMQTALDLFKEFKELDHVDQAKLNAFLETAKNTNNIVLTYKNPEIRNQKIKKAKQQHCKNTAEFIYTIDNLDFYGLNQIVAYIRNTYSYNISRQGIEAILERRPRAVSLYPDLIQKITRRPNIND